MPTHYDVLGVTPEATTAQIRTAYRKAVRTAHPDTGGDAETFHAVQSAYEILSDETARGSYDHSLAHPGEGGDTRWDSWGHEDTPAASWGTSETLDDGPPPEAYTPYIPTNPDGHTQAEPPPKAVPSTPWPHLWPRGYLYTITPAVLLSAVGIFAIWKILPMVLAERAGVLAVVVLGLLLGGSTRRSARRWRVLARAGFIVALALNWILYQYNENTLTLNSVVVAGVTVSAWVAGELLRRVGNATRAYQWVKHQPGPDLLTAQWAQIRRAELEGHEVFWVTEATHDTAKQWTGRSYEYVPATRAKLYNPKRQSMSERMLRGTFHPGLWVALDGSNVMEYCWDNAREAWAATHN